MTVSSRTIRIAAALLIAGDGRTLLVRKRGTEAFMQPGGKIEAHEQPLQALVRELQEELGLIVDPAQASYLGVFAAPAANEPGFTVEAEVFLMPIEQAVSPEAEIEEVLWLDPHQEAQVPLAPLTRDLILPFYCNSLQTPA